MLKSFKNWVTELPPGLERREAKRFQMRNQGSVMAAIAHLSLFVAFVWLGVAPLAVFSAFCVPFYFGLIAMNRAGYHLASVTLAEVEANAHILLCAWLLGPGAGFHLTLLGLALIPFVTVPGRRLWQVLFWAAVPGGAFLLISLGLAWQETRVPLPEPALQGLLILNGLMAFLAPVGVLQLVHRNGENAEDALDEERKRSDDLLMNVMPASIATRLMHGESHIADNLEEVVVMFADIGGFTAWARDRAASDVVEVLDRTFSAFDALAARHGVEKIKTIGDAYMAAATEACADPFGAVASLALDMLDTMKELRETLGVPMDLRVGISAGPAVAGVIGTRRLQYDLWGDTVNVASRMESQGVLGTVQVTERVAQALGGRFKLVERGEVTLKGRGELRCWFLERPTSGS